MADKSISELIEATNVGSTDLFVLEQTGQAKKLRGQIWMNWLINQVGGMGTIRSIEKTGTRGTNPVIDTYTVTFTKTEFVESTDPEEWIENTFTYNFEVVNGIKGDTGSQTYVWIKYAPVLSPTDAQIGDSPDDYIGLYTGTETTAPTTASSYTWFKWKGETGNPAALEYTVVTYQASDNGTTIPVGTWVDTPPYVAPGSFLWTKVGLFFNTGEPVTYYSVTRFGVDGQGSAGTAVPLSDSTNGEVGESLSFSREDHRHPLPTASDIVMRSGSTVETNVSDLITYEPLYITGTISSSQLYINDNRITADMRVIWCVLGTPANVSTNLTATTAAGSITFSGTLTGSTTVSLVLMKTN